MLIRIEGVELPGRTCGPSPERPGGHHGIHVGVQRKNRPDELLGLTPGDAASATWDLECKTKETPDGFDVTGPYVSGPPGGRFVYLSWGTTDDDGEGFEMFRRAKLRLDQVPADVLASAVDQGVLVGRVRLTDERGNPTCASVGPDGLVWRAAEA